jgi:hypothetical protein
MDLTTLNARIRDRISMDWLTPSQHALWEQLMCFDGPPHRVVNVYGGSGVGKTFMGWLLERERLATYSTWNQRPQPVHPRLILDNAATNHSDVRNIRPLVDQLRIQQIILLSRRRADEPAMPAFELRITQEDLEHFYANLYRHLRLTVPEAHYHNYKVALASLS